MTIQSGPPLSLQVAIDSLRRRQIFLVMVTPCSDYQKTRGLIYFARMLDKIRLHAAGQLPPDYFVGRRRSDLL